MQLATVLSLLPFLATLSTAAEQTCGGIANIQCPKGKTCVDDPNDDCNPTKGGADCGGIQCPKGKTCVDDPNDGCDPKKGGADCGGICVPIPTNEFCGGFAGIPCPSGKRCIDNPNDGCNPRRGDADCEGIRVPDRLALSARAVNTTDPETNTTTAANTTSLAPSLAANAPPTKYYCQFVNYNVNMFIFDDEWLGEGEVEKPVWSDFADVYDFSRRHRFYSERVGGEVRVELDLWFSSGQFMTLDYELRLYEGTTEDTMDLDGSWHDRVILDNNQGAIFIDVKNTDEGGDYVTATINNINLSGCRQ